MLFWGQIQTVLLRPDPTWSSYTALNTQQCICAYYLLDLSLALKPKEA
jgi:hypothetical protein